MKLRTIIATLAVTIAGAAGVLIPSPAQAASYYQVVNNQWDGCLSVQGGSTVHAAPVIVEHCDGDWHNLWAREEAEKVGTVQYYYLKVRHTGMCLNVAYWGQADGDEVVQATCSNNTNEQWAFVDIKNSNYKRLVARHSEKCLDKAWSSAVVQWQCHGGDEWWQQWRLAYITEG
jgi:hypothetical protein